jgi:hypothetical protein
MKEFNGHTFNAWHAIEVSLDDDDYYGDPYVLIECSDCYYDVKLNSRDEVNAIIMKLSEARDIAFPERSEENECI